jgi:NAD(P)H-dependent flavin oxidoreductase YrpB (nitropropane dioxygenase family)
VSRQVVSMLDQGAEFSEIRPLVVGARGRKVYETGDLEAGVWSAGLVQGLIHDIPTVADLVTRMVTDAERIIRGGLEKLST